MLQKSLQNHENSMTSYGKFVLIYCVSKTIIKLIVNLFTANKEKLKHILEKE